MDKAILFGDLGTPSLTCSYASSLNPSGLLYQKKFQIRQTTATVRLWLLGMDAGTVFGLWDLDYSLNPFTNPSSQP
ncbi:MAG: hypothetical protein ABIL46_03000 [candidate division WOR-3 bacterium]